MIRAIVSGVLKIKGFHYPHFFGSLFVNMRLFNQVNFDTPFIKNYFTPEFYTSNDGQERNIAAMVD